jgi:2-keto-4-pentenoate hydratase/2-oxohepta-3-ene-1,7-dioic acid hydratase in catechol pathway
MQIASINVKGRIQACIRTEQGGVPLHKANELAGSRWPLDLETLIKEGVLAEVTDWYRREGHRKLEKVPAEALSAETFASAAPLFQPAKIWGIGLNYVAHAGDLDEVAPEEIPASFMKPITTVIGYGDPIQIPVHSHRTTGEAELGIVIGRTCKHILADQWLDYVAGFVGVIDMTAEDILRKNPRYLTLAKSFDTFFSFGPYLVTPDEVKDVLDLEVATVINGNVHARNYVRNMTFTPDKLLAFHSQVMTLQPGDIISTGTPGAVVLQDGDQVACRISGFKTLANPVCDLKKD